MSWLRSLRSTLGFNNGKPCDDNGNLDRTNATSWTNMILVKLLRPFGIQATQAVLSARKNNQLATCKNYAKSLSLSFVFFNSLVLLPAKKKLPCPLGWCSGSVGCYSWISPTPTRRHRHPLCMQAAEYSPIFSAQKCMARTWTLIRIFFWPERLLYPILVHVQILIAITIHVLKGTVGILVILWTFFHYNQLQRGDAHSYTTQVWSTLYSELSS